MPVELNDVSDLSLEISHEFLTELRRRLDEDGIEQMKPRQLQDYSGLLTKIMRAQTGMLKESRALIKDAKDAANKLSYEEKRKLIVEFIQMMPEEHQRELKGELGW